MKKIIFILVLLISFTSCKNKSYSLNPITQEEFAKLRSNEIQLVDLRTPEEFSKGFIEGAISINYFDSDFMSQVESKFDKNKPIYLYCASSGRSVKASSKLIIKRKFTKIYYLKGGYNAWRQNIK